MNNKLEFQPMFRYTVTISPIVISAETRAEADRIFSGIDLEKHIPFAGVSCQEEEAQ